MIHVFRDTTDRYDDDGRRLPPYAKCWASCDLCKTAGEVVYGDTDYDQLSAIAKADLGHTFSSTGGNGQSLCKACRTVTIEYEGGPDSQMRYHFTLLWRKDFAWDEKGQAYTEDDAGPHVREGGQCFHTDPKPYLDDYKRRGFMVVERDKRGAR